MNGADPILEYEEEKRLAKLGGFIYELRTIDDRIGDKKFSISKMTIILFGRRRSILVPYFICCLLHQRIRPVKGLGHSFL